MRKSEMKSAEKTRGANFGGVENRDQRSEVRSQRSGIRGQRSESAGERRIAPSGLPVRGRVRQLRGLRHRPHEELVSALELGPRPHWGVILCVPPVSVLFGFFAASAAAQSEDRAKHTKGFPHSASPPSIIHHPS